MNELEKQLAEIVEKSLNVAEKTGEFVVEQAPLVLQEFYNWHMAESIFFILLFIFLKIVVARAGRLWSYKTKEAIPKSQLTNYSLKGDGRYYPSDRHGDSDAYFFSNAIKVSSYVSLIGVFHNLYDLVFIIIAPKLYLIEYFINN